MLHKSDQEQQTISCGPMLTDRDSAPAGPGCIASCMQHTFAVHAAAVRRRLNCRLKVMEQWVSGSRLTGPSRW